MAVSVLPHFSFYWTRQHGAYITLITSWVIANIITGFTLLQLDAIVFLLAAINVTELITEKLNRKTRLPSYKSTWLNIYGVVTFICGFVLLLYSKNFQNLIIFLAAGAAIFIVVAKFKQQKSVAAEILTFAFFVVAAFSGSNFTGWVQVLTAMMAMTLFFGTSVFIVKHRFGKIHTGGVLLYTGISTILILLLTNASIFGILTSVLILAKTSVCWVFPKQFHQLHIKKIGMIEGVFQLLLISVFIFFY